MYRDLITVLISFNLLLSAASFVEILSKRVDCLMFILCIFQIRNCLEGCKICTNP